MRLLHTQKIQVIEVYGADIPCYAILSHTWSDPEIVLQDLHQSEHYGSTWDAVAIDALGDAKLKSLGKLMGITNLARQNGYDYVWVDTCCIDKTSSAELSEAINSMYRWYVEAEVCYAYLADVNSTETEDVHARGSAFRQSRWFTRGWTLQELIASKQVEFFANDWSCIGVKYGDMKFTKLLTEITGIQLDVLTGKISPQDVSIASRMHWAAHRKTSRTEDVAYCLLGIFDVNIPLLYGEGTRSFIRLQEAILAREDDHSLFAWHSDMSQDEAISSTASKADGLSGLLADSPAKFWDDSDIETVVPLTLTSNPPVITSKGLGIDFLLLPCDKEQVEDADYRVVLSCERIRDGQRQSPVIFLKRIWGMGDQFARVQTHMQVFAPPDTSLLDGGLYERVFVKQNPSLDIRMIRIMAADKKASQLHVPANFEAANWKILDVWPKQGWSQDTQTFQTKDMTFGSPCGIFRIEVSSFGKSTTIDVAVGLHAPSERLCRSWCQILNRHSFLQPESAFAWARREAKTGNIKYSDLSTQDIHGDDVADWLMVTERNRKRGWDITLHVFSLMGATAPNNNRGVIGEIIPVSTLPDIEKKFAIAHIERWPFEASNPQSAKARILASMVAELGNFMGDITVADSIEISVFSRLPIGSKVRVPPLYGTGVTSKSVSEYCINALPEGSMETRRAIQILSEGVEWDKQSPLDASRILEGRIDSFLQLRPIHWAVMGGNGDTVNTLLRAGDNALGDSDRRLTTLHLAMLLKDQDVLKRLLDSLYPEQLNLAYAISFAGDMEDQHSLPTINNGDYPMHFAAAYATEPDFWYTFRQLFSTCSSNFLGEMPLHRAAAMGNLVAISGLTRNVAESYYDSSLTAVDLHGRTALWHAACSDYTGEVTRMLLTMSNDSPRAKLNINLPDLDGLAPVHVASRQGALGCLKRLKKASADLFSRAGALGLFATHFAALFGRKACLEVLLESVVPTVTFTDGGEWICALHCAIANGQEACARVIWDYIFPRAHFKGWSLCILLEEAGPVLKWMYLELDNSHWIAVEDPRKDGATEGFVSISADGETPTLWARPGLPVQTRDDGVEAFFEDSISLMDEAWDAKADKPYRRLETMDPAMYKMDHQDDSEREGTRGKARRVLRSLFDRSSKG